MFSRKLQLSVQKSIASGGSTWGWNGSMLDNAGGCMVAHFDGSNWFTASDIGGVHKLTGAIGGAGIVRQYDAGRSNTTSNTLNNDYHKVAGLHSDGTTAYAFGGDGTNGAIHKRAIGVDSQWTLLSTNYYGNVKGSIGAGRPVGNRRILIDNSTNCVYVACQSVSDGRNGGIAISKNGGAFSNFHNASTFAIGRMFRALQNSANWSDIIYATADNDTGLNASNGNAPGVFVYVNASTSPSVTRIDTIGGGPSNVDWKDMYVVNEGGKDALYIISGFNDGTNGGIWRCTINTNPNGWGTPSVTWVQLLSAGSGGNFVDYRSIYAYRSGSATYAIAGTNPSQSGSANPASLSGTIPSSGGTNYIKEVVRSLNAHTASPTWDAVTNDINVSPSGSFLNVYNTSGGTSEQWLQESGSMNSATNSYSFRKTVIGAANHEVFDLDVDPANQIAVVSGKQGSWVGFNIWSSTLSNITWQPFSNQSGNCTNHGVEVHPTNHLALAHTDTDRMMYFNLEGGDGQSRGCAANFSNPPVGQASFICQGGTNAGRLLIGDDSTRIWASDDWYSVPDRDTAPTMTSDTVTSGSGNVVAVGEWQFSSTTYRLALTDNGGWQLKKNSGAWSTIGSSIGSLTASTHGEYRVICNDGSKDCWVMVSSAGLYYCADITVGSPTFSRIWNESANDQTCEGRITQDPTTRTTLYVSWGKGFNGLWKLTRCDATTFTSSGSGSGATVTPSGPGTATAMTSGSLALTNFYGSIDVDPADGSMVVTEPGYTGLSKIHYAADGVTFSDITDTVFPEVCQVPNSVRKRGSRIYVGSWTAGVVYGVLS